MKNLHNRKVLHITERTITTGVILDCYPDGKHVDMLLENGNRLKRFSLSSFNQNPRWLLADKGENVDKDTIRDWLNVEYNKQQFFFEVFAKAGDKVKHYTALATNQDEAATATLKHISRSGALKPVICGIKFSNNQNQVANARTIKA